MRRWVWTALWVVLSVGTVIAGAQLLAAQAMPVRISPVSETYPEWAINELSRRVTRMEEARFDERVAVLENNLMEMKYTTRAVTSAVIAQLALAFAGMWAKRRQGGQR